MFKSSEPCDINYYCVEHINLLRDSFRRLLGRELISENRSPEAIAREIYLAPFIVVSHNTAVDPIFTYGNQAALTLFEMTWTEFTSLPSRCSAEPPRQQERAHLLAEVSKKGFIEHYSGIRVSKTGKRFEIRNVTVWNLTYPDGTDAGQAASYPEWRFLQET